MASPSGIERSGGRFGPEVRLYFALAIGWDLVLILAGGAWSRSSAVILFFLVALALTLLVIGLARYGRRIGPGIGEALAWAAMTLCVLGVVLLLPVLAIPSLALVAAGCRRRSREQSARYRELRQTWSTRSGRRRAALGVLIFFVGIAGSALSFDYLPHTNPVWWITGGLSVIGGVLVAGRLGLLVFVQESGRRTQNALLETPTTSRSRTRHSK
jgi:hypothetical protein